MIVRNSILLVFFSAFSVLLGIVRDRLLAQFVGVGAMLDVYNASFRIPDLALGIFLSFATASTVVPFLTQDYVQGNKEKLAARFSSLFFFFLIMMTSISILVAITLPLYASRIVPGFSPDQLALFITTTRILMLQPILLGLSSLISCLAQLRHEFVVYGIAPLVYTLSIIGSIFFYDTYSLQALVVGVVCGAVFHIAIQSVTLYRARLQLSLASFSFAYIREHLHLSLPRSGTYIVSQLRILFYTAFATTLGVGVLSSFLFAQKITDAIAQMLAQSMSSASLPTLSSLFESNDHSRHKKIVLSSILFLFSSATIIATVVFVFREQVVSLLYGNSSMNHLIQMYLLASIGTLPFQVTTYYLATAFNSMKKTNIVFYSNAIATTIAVLVCFTTKGYGVISLVYAIVAMNICYFLIIASFYSRRKVQVA